MCNIDELWNEVAGDAKPVAHNLKFDLDQRWVRFHSLPDSQRYPNDDAEMNAIIHRHNEILLSVFISGEQLQVMQMAWSDESSAQVKADGFTYWRDVLPDEDDLDCVNHLYVRSMPWATGALDWAIAAAANDELYGFMVIGVDSRAIYHPYDGGLDLILSTTDERDALKDQYASYLSSHPAGL